jgi:very-short-patch-repair endonuclease
VRASIRGNNLDRTWRRIPSTGYDLGVRSAPRRSRIHRSEHTMSRPEHAKSASERMRAQARELRKNATGPERALWGLLRDRRLCGAKFRRQHAVGPYVVDFYCPVRRLVVEIDGRSHDDRGEADRRRQEYLESVAKLKVFRVRNDDVLYHREAVILGLLRALGIGEM